MFSGLKKFHRNITALKAVFKNSPGLVEFITNYGLLFESYSDATFDNGANSDFYSAFTSPKLPERYINLTRGLDEQSAIDIADIINGFLLIKKNDRIAKRIESINNRTLI